MPLNTHELFMPQKYSSAVWNRVFFNVTYYFVPPPELHYCWVELIY